MQFDVIAKPQDQAAVSVVFVAENKKLAGAAAQFLAGSAGAVTQALAAPGSQRQARARSLDLLSPAGHKGRRVLIVGLGDPRELNAVRHASRRVDRAASDVGAETTRRSSPPLPPATSWMKRPSWRTSRWARGCAAISSANT